ncbi:MAG: histidine kinase [Cyclobacteriaceae bacterium]|nr:histidine kinase [Cyclobacteriaceae bacterium]
MSKQSIKNLGKELLLILFLSSIMAYFMGLNYSQEWQYMWKRFAITYIIWLVMWFGNSYVSYLMDKAYSWLKDPGKRFVLGILAAVVYSVLAMLVLKPLFILAIGISITDNNPETLILTAGISALILSGMYLRHFLFSWRALALQEEKMKNEVLTSNFEMLKSQVNPHFMFNSLNTLTALIYQNQDLAAKYVGQLSNVYRSVLSSGKHEVVTIEEELKMLDSYIFLQSIRFEGKFKVNVDLSDEIKKKHIPPMVLQMLIENCIKHNEITSENPLIIKVFTEKQSICVKNKIAKKQVLPGDNSSIGLTNIKARFKMLSDEPVKILDNGNEFIVKLPLLTVE